jgi:hypothetical protein
MSKCAGGRASLAGTASLGGPMGHNGRCTTSCAPCSSADVSGRVYLGEHGSRARLRLRAAALVSETA